LVIFDKNNLSLPLGIATYHDIEIDHGVIEVGCVIYSKKLQKTRIATEAMYLMMKNIFDKYGYRRYQWRCNALNMPSRKAAERLGFKFEGIFRNSNVFKGYNRDTAWYSIIKDEWQLNKTKLEKWLMPTNFDEYGNQLTKL
jgi:RimJ/RimL family protein N-acetyltransferase